ncbi:MAG: hypothetical protein GX364_00915 [Firmicutes bacterium]|jgi:vancomycin resistance protein YoaR|nr:hypothetical protein [Bacillota bacterium]
MARFKFFNYKFLLLVLLISAVIFFLVFNPLDRYKRWRYGVKSGVRLEGLLVERLLEDELIDIIGRAAPSIEVPPRNAFVDHKNNELVPEVNGKKIHTSMTVEKLLNAGSDSWVSLEIIDIDPLITVSLYESIANEIGRYQTCIGGGGGRAENIILATSLLDNYLLSPGEVFSFNKAVGPITWERGFRYAPIISGGAIVPGIGGGLCQVASTLYNAVMNASLEVVERTPHSRPVGYVPRGKDATVSTNIDFKFRNNTGDFILLRTSNAGNMINISILNNGDRDS